MLEAPTTENGELIYTMNAYHCQVFGLRVYIPDLKIRVLTRKSDNGYVKIAQVVCVRKPLVNAIHNQLN